MTVRRYDHIVWDFNGTILDDVCVNIEATNVLLARRGKPPIPSRAAYLRLFRFPIIDYYRDIGFDFSSESYDDVAVEWHVEYRRLAAGAETNPGVRELIAAFRAAGIPQTVISASEKDLLRRQLASLGLLDCFEDTVARDDVNADGKDALACAWAARRAPGRVLMIGDTDHDAACARAAGFDPVLVSRGHQGEDLLARTGAPVFPDFAALRAWLTEGGAL